jgi:hypothetical protein
MKGDVHGVVMPGEAKHLLPNMKEEKIWAA